MGKQKKQKHTGVVVAVVFAVLLVLSVGIFFVIQNQKKSKQVAVSISDTGTTQSVTEKETADPHTGQARSLLTGMWVPKEQTEQRPVAVMYSNIADAMPQSSIGSADIVFESLVEGGITRLCCVFDYQTTLTKIGPVRSCRTYYLLFAKELEAIYVHFGASEYAAAYLARPEFHALDGMVYCDFYRTTDRVAPHNAYTSWTGIMDSANYREYGTEYPAGYTAPFKFNEDDTKDIIPASGETCKTFYPGYLYNKPWFTYDESTKTYLRYQFDGPQIDAETQKQLSYKNILVKYVTPAYYENGTPNYKTYGTNSGLYITDGVAIPVTWTKSSETEGATKYYYADGSEVIFNQGKTYICQIETTQEVQILAE